MFYYSERGQGLVEYAFLIVLIAIVVILAVAFFGTKVEGLYHQIVNMF